MPARKSRTALKTALLAPAGSLIAWGVQQAGDPVAGGVAIVVGVVFMAGFVVIQEYDIPYESEIVDIIRANSDRLDEASVKEIAKEASDEAERRGIDLQPENSTEDDN